MNHAIECSYLASYLAKSILQFAMQNCQLLEVTVGFVDGNENLVGFIDSLIKSTLGRTKNSEGMEHPIRTVLTTKKQVARWLIGEMRDNWHAEAISASTTWIGSRYARSSTLQKTGNASLLRNVPRLIKVT